MLLDEALAQVVRLEVSTNNLLMVLLDGDEPTQALFLSNLERLAGRRLREGVLKREHHVPSRREGLADSQHDFAILDESRHLIASIETKISASVTSDDQISRYVADLVPGGALFVVTPSYGYTSMRAAIDTQLGPGAARSISDSGATRWQIDDDKTVCLLRWSECLVFPDAPDALVTLSRAIEGASTSWRPFTVADLSPERGQVVIQIARTALALAEYLDDLCLQKGWSSARWNNAVDGIGRTINVLGHGVDIGFLPELWRIDPQLQYANDHRAMLMPSPFWITRAQVGVVLTGEPKEQTKRAFEMLATIRAARPLRAVRDMPEQVVVDALQIDAEAALAHVHDSLVALLRNRSV